LEHGWVLKRGVDIHHRTFTAGATCRTATICSYLLRLSQMTQSIKPIRRRSKAMPLFESNLLPSSCTNGKSPSKDYERVCCDAARTLLLKFLDPCRVKKLFLESIWFLKNVIDIPRRRGDARPHTFNTNYASTCKSICNIPDVR
jgi:hypothetical protein